MTGSALGGGVIFVVAALLWAAVLVPAWVRRRDFRASERNAIRLHRTLRVLAETAEVPGEVRVEATARQALAHEKLIRSAQKRQEAEREAELAAARTEQARAESHAQLMQRREASVARAARLRRPGVRAARVVAVAAVLLGAIGVLVGLGLMIAGTGPAALLWSLSGGIVGASTLVALAPGRMASSANAPADTEVADEPEEAAAGIQLPVAPAPVSAAAHEASQRAAALRIARARALARSRAERPTARVNQTDSMLLREVRVDIADAAARASSEKTAVRLDKPAAGVARSAEAPQVGRAVAPESAATVAARSQQLAASNRLQKMGVVGDTSAGLPDLDEVLRRRRNVG